MLYSCSNLSFAKVNDRLYAIDGPERWDVIAFHPPFASKSTFIFRVVGLPGETVSYDQTGLRLNDHPLQIPDRLTNITYLSIEQAYRSKAFTGVQFPYSIPKDHYFVLGDNTSDALDSRFWGAVPRSNILGRVKGK